MAYRLRHCLGSPFLFHLADLELPTGACDFWGAFLDFFLGRWGFSSLWFLQHAHRNDAHSCFDSFCREAAWFYFSLRRLLANLLGGASYGKDKMRCLRPRWGDRRLVELFFKSTSSEYHPMPLSDSWAIKEGIWNIPFRSLQGGGEFEFPNSVLTRAPLPAFLSPPSSSSPGLMLPLRSRSEHGFPIKNFP